MNKPIQGLEVLTDRLSQKKAQEVKVTLNNSGAEISCTFSGNPFRIIYVPKNKGKLGSISLYNGSDEALFSRTFQSMRLLVQNTGHCISAMDKYVNSSLNSSIQEVVPEGICAIHWGEE